MYNVVLDTNVIVAALRSRRGASNLLLRKIDDGSFRVNLSVALALEYEDVIKRPGLYSHPESVLDGFLEFLIRTSNLIPGVTRRRPILRDSGDEHILELAAECGAMIVTHNIRDFKGAYALRIKLEHPVNSLRC